MVKLIIAEKNGVILNEIDCLTKSFKTILPERLIFCNLDEYPDLGLDLRCLSPLGTPIIFYSFFKDLSYLEKQIWYCSEVDYFLKVPFLLGEFSSIISSIPTTTKITPALSKCLENCIKKKAELINHKIRHDFKNVIAALRLLLGAFLIGDISLDTLNTALKSLYADTDNNKDRITVLTQLVYQWGKIHSTTSPKFNGKILIVDDHLRLNSDTDQVKGDFGWQYVYEAILTNSNHFTYEIVAFDNYDAASNFIKNGKNDIKFDDIEFAILDIDLGNDNKSGLHLLDEIRRTNPFTPVLMMTAHDDAKVTQLALELQADAYFVKELRDSKDRSSQDYYCKFREIIESFPSTKSKERLLYNEFKRKLPAIVEGDKNSPYKVRLEEGVVGNLTKLFLLLRIIDNHYSASSLMLSGSNKNYAELLVILIDALLVRLNWDRQKVKDDDEPLTKLAAWQTECDFYINKKGELLIGRWTVHDDAICSAADFFGYNSDTIDHKLLSALVQPPPIIPNIEETEPPPNELLNINFVRNNGTVICVNLTIIPQIDNGKLTKYKVRVEVPNSEKSPLSQFAEKMQPYTDIRHGIERNITKEEVLEKLGEFLALFKEPTTLQASNSSNNTNEYIAKIILEAKNRDISREFGDHSIRSKMGAEALLLGTYLKNGDIGKTRWDSISGPIFREWGRKDKFDEVRPFLEEECETNGLYISVNATEDNIKNILFIDDHGWENGWFYVAQVCLNNSKLNCFELKGTINTSFEKYLEQLKPLLMQADLVLLDLKMPEKKGQTVSENTGLKVAQIFRKWDVVTPIILLSAYYDSLIVKKAIKLGVTNYFPKEIPNTNEQNKFKTYAKDFEETIQCTLTWQNNDLTQPRKKLKQAIRGLEDTFNECDTLTLKLIMVIKDPNCHPGSSNLASMMSLSLPNEIDLKKVVINQVIRLFKQAVFFWQLPMEKYLYRWPEYFCDAENKCFNIRKKLRHQFLSYDQVWLNCGAIAEFIFNVVLIASGQREKTIPAGNLKNDSRLQNIITHQLGKDACKYIIDIWDMRNSWYHPTNPNRNPLEEYKETWGMLNKTIEFLTELKIIAFPIISQTYSVLDLHQNLKDSKQRQEYEEEISKREKAKKQLPTSANNAQQAEAIQNRYNQLEEDIGTLKAKYSTLALHKILKDRKQLVEQLASIPQQP